MTRVRLGVMSGEYPDRDPQTFYELARERHAAQADTLNVLDTKLGLLLSMSSALLGILVAVYALRPDAIGAWALVLLSASGAAWLVLVAFAVHAIWHRPWRSGPQLQTVFDLHFSETDSRIKWRAANTFFRDYKHNQTHEKRKARALHWVLGLFIGQTVLLVAALALVAHDQRSDTTRRSECPAQAVRDARAALGQVALAPARVRRVGSAPARPRSWCKSLMAYAASGTARARASPPPHAPTATQRN
jgi:hypothetical protein